MSTLNFVDNYKNLRLRNYDYKNGYFFITNKTNFNKPYLRDKIYVIVKNHLETINSISCGAHLDYATIVPTHIHCILVLNNSSLPLSELWRRFKAKTTYESKKLGLISESLWQRNFYEHVIRNEHALSKIRVYIRNNPLKEELPLDEIYGQ